MRIGSRGLQIALVLLVAGVMGITASPASAVVVATCTPPQNAQLGSTGWVGGSPDGPYWDDARNWDNGVPSSSCDASIGSGFGVVMIAGGSAHSLALDGTLTVEGSTSNGNPQESAFSAATTIASTGNLILTSVGSNPGAAIVGGTIDNSGLISVNAGAVGPNTYRDLRAGITNNASGTIGIHNDVSTCGCNSGGGLLNNGSITIDAGKTAYFSQTGAGYAFTQSGGTFTNNGRAIFDGSVTHNSGTTTGNPIQVCGNLDAHGTGTASFEFFNDGTGTYCSGGSITADIGASDTVALNNTATGQLVVNAGAFSNHGTLTLEGSAGDKYITGSGLLTNDGTVNFQGTGRSELQKGLTNTGTVTVASGETLTMNGTVSQAGGTFTVAGTLDANQPVTLSGGTLANTGAFVAASGAAFTHDGGDATGNPIEVCAGNLAAPGPGNASFLLDGSCGSVGINSDIGSGDTVKVQTAAAQIDVTAPGFTNYGTLSFNSTSTNLVQLHGSGANATLTNQGTLNFTGTTVAMALANKATTNIKAAQGVNTTFTSPITQSAGNLNVDATATVNAQGDAQLSGGTIANSGTLGAIGFTHTGGNTTGNPIAVCGPLSALGGGTASFQLVPAAAGNPNGGCGGSGSFSTDVATSDTVEIVPAGATFDVFTPAGFTNDGHLTVDSGSNLVQIHGNGVTNDGTLTLGTGTGAITLAAGQLTNDGTMSVASGATINDSGAVVAQNAGTLDVAGILTSSGTQSGGMTSVEGNWDLGGTSLPITGGTLLGTGTVTGDVTNGGTVSPGSVASVGTLTITGNYTQQVDGTLSARIASGGNDVLHVGGTAQLDGTLAVDGGSFIPASGQTFTVLSDTSQTGQFGTLTGQGYTAVYDPTDVKLVPVQVSVSPTAIGYGTGSAGPVLLGSTAPTQTSTLKNNGQEPVTIATVSITGAQAAEFSVRSDSCSNATLQPGATCTVGVAFSPSAVGSAAAQLNIPDNAVGGPHHVGLTGIGGVRSANPSVSSLSFQALPGETARQTVTLSNPGTVDLHVASVTIGGTSASRFHLVTDDCTEATVAGGRTCAVTVSFAPTAPGSYAAQLTFADDASSGSSQSVSLHGDTAGSGEGAGTITGRVLNGRYPTTPPVAGAEVSACHGTGSNTACRVQTVGADGRYTLAAPPGAVTVTVYPPGNLSSDTAQLTASASQATVHDFVLSNPKALNGGVSFGSNDAMVTSGVPRFNQGQQFAMHVPVRISRTGTPNKVRIYVYVIGLGSNAQTERGPFYTAAAAIFGVHYSAQGIADRVSRPVEEQINCPASSCAHLAGESGVDVGGATAVTAHAARRSAARPATAVARTAAAQPCPAPKVGMSLKANDFGGVDLVYTSADGQEDHILGLGQVAIPSPPTTGNLGADLFFSTVIGGANFLLNLNPGIGAFNTILGVANAASALNDSNNADLRALQHGSLALTIVSKIAENTHGPESWFANVVSGISNVYSAGSNSLTHSQSVLQFDATPDCPQLNGDAYVDPSGTVRTTKGVPVTGAKVTLRSAATKHAKPRPVRNGSVVMSPSNRRNSDHTGLNGGFGWNTLPGFYDVTAAKPGCKAVHGRGAVTTSPLFRVPPPRDNLVLKLSCPKLRLKATRLTLRVFKGGLGSRELLATVRVRRGPTPTRQLLGLVTFKAGGRTLGGVPVNAATGTASVVVPVSKHPAHRFTAVFGGNGRFAASRISKG